MSNIPDRPVDAQVGMGPDFDLSANISCTEREQQQTANKYKYWDFGSFAGERLLKSILRKILPLALFQTWEVLAAENQANGNDAYLSITKLAEARQRTERKVRMDLFDLQGRQLLTLRSEWKIFRQADDTPKARPVAIKDFGRLYDLAYEYLLWTQSDGYIPPEREYADLLRANEPLMRKLMRFDNYRRLLCNRTPGPARQEKEIYSYYKTYEETTPSHIHEVVEGVNRVTDSITEAIRKEYLKEALKEDLQEDLQEDLKKVSIERIETSDNTYQQNKNNKERQNEVSSISEVCLEERREAGAIQTEPLIPNEEITEEAKEVSSHPTKQTNRTKQTKTVMEKGPAKQASGVKTRLETAVKEAQQAIAAYQGKKTKAVKAASNPLIERFVREMSPILGDENLASSITRSLRAVEQKNLSQEDIWACLVRAYGVARDTKKIHERYRRPNGKALRMPLFCTMFERFAQKSSEGHFDYDDESLAQAINADERLHLFLIEWKPEEAEQAVPPVQKSSLPENNTLETSAGNAPSPMGMGQCEAEALRGEILRNAEALGVTEALIRQDGNGAVVVLVWRGQSMEMFSQEHWRKVALILARKQGVNDATLS